MLTIVRIGLTLGTIIMLTVVISIPRFTVDRTYDYVVLKVNKNVRQFSPTTLIVEVTFF